MFDYNLFYFNNLKGEKKKITKFYLKTRYVIFIRFLLDILIE